MDSPAVGRRFVLHTAAMTLPAGCWLGEASDLGRPGFTPGFSAARGRAGLAANHNSLAANSKIGGSRTP